MGQNLKSSANVCLRIVIDDKISSKEKEDLLFSIRDRIKHVMVNHHIEHYKILFTTDENNNKE